MNEIQKRIIATLKRKMKDGKPIGGYYRVGLRVPNCVQEVVREDVEKLGFQYLSNKSWDSFTFLISEENADRLAAIK